MFPARAGMDRRRRCHPRTPRNVPRPRGDGPAPALMVCNWARCSPPARGWTAKAAPILDNHAMFPARAGMDRRWSGHRPGMRVCSPPARGWTAICGGSARWGGMFPARAGMDREYVTSVRSMFDVPRPRGDGPKDLKDLVHPGACSPPARGWTGAGRGAFPAARWLGECSPPARGWTGVGVDLVRRGRMFPARAGMDRRRGTPVRRPPDVPRPRGDGPTVFAGAKVLKGCSPPARGWTGRGCYPIRR